MTPSVAGLVLLSAVLHVLWNTLVKDCEDKLAFAWLTNVLGAVFLIVPFGVVRLLDPGTLSPAVWWWAGASGFMQAAYVVLLFAAYTQADLSMVYPVCRGLGPLFIMLSAGWLVGDAVDALQGLAVGLVVLGTTAVGATNRTAQGKLSTAGIVLAVGAALATAGYSLADRAAMRLRPGPNAVELLFLSYSVVAVLLTLYVLGTRRGFAACFAQFRRHRRDVLLVAVLTLLSYGCIVAALGNGNVVLVTAGRNVGILFSTAAGAWLLREQVTRQRVLGSWVVFGGLVLLVLG